ncbi:MAG: aminoacyl-tRNA hydrolase [Pseudomonadota bacterium]
MNKELPPTERWMVAGLGNPEMQHVGNRHNIGFMVVDALFETNDRFVWRPSGKFSADIALGEIDRTAVVLVKPLTYMNLCGQSVAPVSRFYRIPPNQILVIHDDVDLNIGRLKVKRGGGDGGHKGVRSVAQELGSDEFGRIRFGIGRPERGSVSSFVLNDFDEADINLIEETVKRATQAVLTVLKDGFRTAMNLFNCAPRGEAKQEDTEKKDTGKKQMPNAETN